MSMLLCFKQVFSLAEVGVLGLLLMQKLFSDTMSEPRAPSVLCHKQMFLGPLEDLRPISYFFFKSG